MASKRFHQSLILIILIAMTIFIFDHHKTEIQAQNQFVNTMNDASKFAKLEIDTITRTAEENVASNEEEVLLSLHYQKFTDHSFYKKDSGHHFTYVLHISPKTTHTMSPVVLAVYDGQLSPSQFVEKEPLISLENRILWKSSNY